ncbi:hypothetical protein [Mesorhizobium sp.]|uniref:hypothetical protein n=1 Tax=Mesorhizobium sp. TaxID=1871066 RepID=UPI000FE71A73|nr:hypothetical protein [Mesorhizobium sp.]RWM04389.1 MAG: hypothetical protein EOR71_26440 [Mesorhizobium sp.]
MSRSKIAPYVVAAFALLLMLSSAAAVSSMSEQRARSKAVAFLKGDPYGQTHAQVARAIKDARLRPQGPAKACTGLAAPAWEFHVVVTTVDKDQFDHGVIDGNLALDARSGEFLCGNLPLLD